MEMRSHSVWPYLIHIISAPPSLLPRNLTKSPEWNPRLGRFRKCLWHMELHDASFLKEKLGAEANIKGKNNKKNYILCSYEYITLHASQCFCTPRYGR